MEEDLTGFVVPLRNPPVPGEMGRFSDLIAVSLGGSGVLAVLARSLSEWVRQRRSNVHIKIAVRPGGKSISIDATNVAGVEALLLQALSEAKHED
jgi:hypothetical protein